MDPFTRGVAIALREHDFRRAVIVTGDRNVRNRLWDDLIWKNLSALLFANREGRLRSAEVLVIHGDCRGVDRMADRAAEALGIVRLAMPYPAGMGTRGGPYRNRQMLAELLYHRDNGAVVAVHAYHPNIEESKGTKDMMTAAHDADVPVVLWESMQGARRSWPS